MEDRLEHAGYINGAFVTGAGSRFAVENPSDETIVDEVIGLSLEQTDCAIGAARDAFDRGGWGDLARQERVAAVRRYGGALRSYADRLRELAIAEAGCPMSSSVMGAQVQMPLRMTDELADLYSSLPEILENPLPLHERVNPYSIVQSLRRFVPIGVVSAIAAYNVPFYTAFIKVIPALLAGNTVVLRPNPLTPLSAMVFAEAARDAGLPAGVLNVVIEEGLEGARLMTTDERVDMISFTGSCVVGANVAAQAAPTLKRLVLELGGKSAQIFLPDAIDKAVMHGTIVCTSHAGQGCALGTRLFVPEESKAQVLDGIAAAFERIRIGPASDPATQLGPLISASQRARCETFTNAAVEHGGRVVFGGKRPAGLDKGYYWEPTLLDLPDNRNPAAQEEIFGPVVGVIGYQDLDHAVAMANDSKFGLSGYVHGADRGTALKVALQIRSGTVNVNGGAFSSFSSSGGIKMSGVGRERGEEGIRAFQQINTLNIGA